MTLDYNVGANWTTATTPYGDGDLGTPGEAYCFAAGTGIATPSGEVAVETLSIGDLVQTADGRAVPVRWIGRQTILRRFYGERACPVRIRAGALGNALPHSALVNGTTITFDPAPARATYYHVETETHEVILANGAPAETYLASGDRRTFDNFDDYVRLYGEDIEMAELPCPRIASQRLLPNSPRERLAET